MPEEKKGMSIGTDMSKCAENHGRIVKSDDTTVTFEDGVVVRKGSMEVLHDPRKKQ